MSATETRPAVKDRLRFGGEWETKSLAEIVKPSKSIRYGIVQPGNHDETGCFMLRSQDYSKGWAGPDNMHKVSNALQDQYKNARIQRDDLVITVVGAGIGQVVTVPAWLDGAILSRSTARISIDDEKAARAFVSALLESPVGRRQILDCQKEGAQPVVSCVDLAKFSVLLPPLPEQRAIAAALSDVDDLLQSLDRLIAKKRDVKQGAMQQLLTGTTRLPGFEGEWKTKTFAEILRVVNTRGKQVDTKDYRPWGTIPVVDQGQKHIVGFLDDSSRAISCPLGGLIVFGDHTRVFKFIDFDFAAGADGTQVLDALPGHEPRYWYYRLLSAEIPNTGYNRHFKFLKALVLLAPPADEQRAIAAVLSDMDAEIHALEKRREKVAAIMQGMMQELLTGRTRLPIPEGASDA